MLRTWCGIGCALLLAGCLLSLGCSESEAINSRAQFAAEGQTSPATAASAPPRDAAEVLRYAAALPGPGAAAAEPLAGINRKIMYSAMIDLVVEDFTGVPDQIVTIVKKFDGYIADSNLSGASGDSRRGTWKIRVPVDRFESFVASAKGLGELIRAGTSSQDVSEEYYDVEARIRNKTKEEERLIKLLEDRPGKLEDVIAIERELSRVREEIERLQGRLRVLADLTSLTTVTLSITEIRDYQPPQAPTLVTRIGRSFGGSVGSLRAFGEGVLIAAAAIAPWLPVLAIGMALGYWIARRGWRWLRTTVPNVVQQL